MANLVYMAKSAWTGLLDSIRSKAGTQASMTVSQAQTAVENIPTGGGGGEIAEFIDGSISVYEDATLTTGVRYYAFFSCNSLISVSIPNASLGIGSSAFYNLMRLETVYAPKISRIEPNAFRSCRELLYADFPSVQHIGSGAFSSCAKLSYANFPALSSAWYSIFISCPNLTSVNLGNLSEIPNGTFSSCVKLETVIVHDITSIGAYAFYNCQSFTGFDFGSCTYIGSNAFSGCRALKTANFPMLTASIPSACFTGCTSLSMGSFPKVSAIVGNNTFSNCSVLLSLYFLGSSVVELATPTIFSNTPISGYTTHTGGVHGSIFVPASLYDAYRSATNWSVYADRFVSV